MPGMGARRRCRRRLLAARSSPLMNRAAASPTPGSVHCLRYMPFMGASAADPAPTMAELLVTVPAAAAEDAETRGRLTSALLWHRGGSAGCWSSWRSR